MSLFLFFANFTAQDGANLQTLTTYVTANLDPAGFELGLGLGITTAGLWVLVKMMRSSWSDRDD